MNIVVLASGEGTTLQAVLDACAEGRLPARVAGVISNNGAAGALRRAREAGVPTRHLSAATAGGPAAADQALRDALTELGAEWVLLAGYMKRLGPLTLAAYGGRIINTHPALLPEFGGQGMFGMHVHRAVLAAGRPWSGASVHWVDENYDTGAVIAQVRVPVEPGDCAESLAARVQAAERRLLIQVLTAAASGSLKLPPQTAQPSATS
ncbi:MAG TPA: phosphoribosylglycinamide formyltransferase [Steroidobacteraceae bacterium]|jgi:phosphoribosylglycinamide formyltransferase-1